MNPILCGSTQIFFFLNTTIFQTAYLITLLFFFLPSLSLSLLSPLCDCIYFAYTLLN